MDLGFNLAQSNRNLKHPTSRQIFGDTSGLLCKNDPILRRRVGKGKSSKKRSFYGQADRNAEIGVFDFCILGVNFHVCRTYACVKYLTNIMSVKL